MFPPQIQKIMVQNSIFFSNLKMHIMKWFEKKNVFAVHAIIVKLLIFLNWNFLKLNFLNVGQLRMDYFDIPFEVFMIFSNIQNDNSRDFKVNTRLRVLISNTILQIQKAQKMRNLEDFFEMPYYLVFNSVRPHLHTLF